MPSRSRKTWLNPDRDDIVWCSEISMRCFGTVLEGAGSSNYVIVRPFPFEAFPIVGGGGARMFVRESVPVHRKFLGHAALAFYGPVRL